MTSNSAIAIGYIVHAIAYLQAYLINALQSEVYAFTVEMNRIRTIVQGHNDVSWP